MKLLCCVKCNEIFSLSHDYKECVGGHGGGQYVNHIDAKVWGDPKNMFILGFANSSFENALRAQYKDGDSEETFRYGGRVEVKGRDFTAFVIPESASSITRVNARFDPIVSNVLSHTQGPKQ